MTSGHPKARDHRGSRGVALVIVMAIVVVLGYFGAGMLARATANSVQTVYRQQSLQAFWAAEAGLQVARYRILRDQGYRTSPCVMNGTNGPAHYAVNVTRTGNVFCIQSDGTCTVSRVSRRVAQNLQIIYGTIPTNFAIFTDHSDVDLRQFTVVDGSIFSWGDVIFWQDSMASGTVYGANFESQPGITDPATLQPAPEFPPLDTTYYDQQIAHAVANDSGLDFKQDVNLAGGTWYVTGDWYHTRATRITSTPPGGTIVVSGDVTLNKDGITIGPNVNLICGGRFTLMKSATFNTNCNIYASGSVSVMQSGTIFSQSSLTTPSQIDCQHTISFSGLMYCGGPCNLYQDTVVGGMIYAKGGMFMDQRSRVNWAPQLLPSGWPKGLSTNVSLVIVQSDWREL